MEDVESKKELAEKQRLNKQENNKKHLVSMVDLSKDTNKENYNMASMEGKG